jgi:hypothetical protein
MVCFFTEYYWGDQIEEDEMDAACIAHGVDENFGLKA